MTEATTTQVRFELGDRSQTAQELARQLASDPEQVARAASRGFTIAGPRPLIDALRQSAFGSAIGADGQVEPEAMGAGAVVAVAVVAFAVGFAAGYMVGSSGGGGAPAATDTGGEGDTGEESGGSGGESGGSGGDSGDSGGSGGSGGSGAG